MSRRGAQPGVKRTPRAWDDGVGTTTRGGSDDHPDVPVTQPVPVAPDTWLIPDLAAAEPGTYVPVNSMLIRGAEPILVDSGAPIHRERWLEQVFSLVDPEDVRWVFLSHDDGDHTGALHDVLALCPRATVPAVL